MAISILKTENGDDSFIGGKLISHEVCDRLIEEFENREFGDTKNFGISGGIVQKDVKRSIDAGFRIENTPYYEKELLEVIKEYAMHYGPSLTKYSSRWGIVESYNVQKYNPGEGFYKYHHEASGPESSNRILVFMTYLNDVENAGTEFLYQKLRTNSIKGLTIIWPAGFTHTHKGIISQTETKYIATGWISYLPKEE